MSASSNKSIGPWKCTHWHSLPHPRLQATNYRHPHQVTLDLLAVMRTLNEMQPLALTKNQVIHNTSYRQFLKRMGWKDAEHIDGFAFPNPGDRRAGCLVSQPLAGA